MSRGMISAFRVAMLFGAVAWSSSVLSQEASVPPIEIDEAEQQEASVPPIEIDEAEQQEASVPPIEIDEAEQQEASVPPIEIDEAEQQEASVPPIEIDEAEQQEASVPPIEIDEAEQQVFGSNLSIRNRIKVITKQFHPSLQKAIRTRIMYLYRVDNLDDLKRLATLLYLLSENRNEPSVFLLRTDDTDTEADFVGKPLLLRLADSESNKAKRISAAVKAYSVDNTWNDLQTRLIQTIADENDTSQRPLYLATDERLPEINPVSSVVFFDFDPKFYI